MVAPVIAGAGIGTAGSLLSGVLGNKSSKKAADKAYKRQKEFAQHGIQWKAQDARSAGLHPLFAMGAGSANYQPSFIAGQDPMGTALSDSAQQLGQAYAQSKAPPPGTPSGAIGKAQLRAVNAQASRDEAAAMLSLSNAKRNEANANTTQDGDIYSSTLIDESLPAPRGRTKLTPAEIISAAKKDQSRTAGKSPMFKRHVYGTDRAGRAKTIDLPWSDEGPLEEFGPGKAVATLLKALGLLDEAPPKFRRATKSRYHRRSKKRRHSGIRR